jgi:hypothetical protein
MISQKTGDSTINNVGENQIHLKKNDVCFRKSLS